MNAEKFKKYRQIVTEIQSQRQDIKQISFLDDLHKDRFKSIAYGKLQSDQEWAAAAYICSSHDEIWSKTRKHFYPERHEIDWEKIFNTDFGSGHKAALHWAFAMYSGNAWGSWLEGDRQVDIMSRSFSMDTKLRHVIIQALMIRWM
ncbi:hypothetical protein GGQ84_002148 [Desulfitispora alkaliphila]|uniref:DUF6075 family protein n=1 Tax=Desulfitispora alkaliphila TaxID=622674 RepID=UPI003D21F1EE